MLNYIDIGYYMLKYLPYASLDFHETKAKMCILKLPFQQYMVLYKNYYLSAVMTELLAKN